jgi:hypothetical protein
MTARSVPASAAPIPFRPGSEGYEAATRIFNSRISKHHVKLAWAPKRPEEMAWIIRQAKAQGISISLRAGGHGVSGRALDGEWVVDMRGFNGLRFIERDGDPYAQVAVGGGAVWAEVDEFCGSVGRAVPGGTVSSTGVAGLTFGGGLGWLLKQYGLACDQLDEVRGFNGNGRFVSISDQNQPEIMRILRGNGHGLLAATELIFTTNPIPERVSAGSVEFHLNDAEYVLKRILAARCPDGISFSPALIETPARSKVLSVDGVSFGPLNFKHWVESAAGLPCLRSTVRSRTYVEAQQMLDNPARYGRRQAWRSTFTQDLTPSSIPWLIESFKVAPSGSQIFIELLGGAAKHEQPGRPSTFGLRHANFDVLLTSGWLEMAAGRQHVHWLDSTKEGLARHLRLAADAPPTRTIETGPKHRQLLSTNCM